MYQDKNDIGGFKHYLGNTDAPQTFFKYSKINSYFLKMLNTLIFSNA